LTASSTSALLNSCKYCEAQAWSSGSLAAEVSDVSSLEMWSRCEAWERGDDRDAGVGTEECVAGLEGEMGEAEGSQIVGIGHGFTYRLLGGGKGRLWMDRC